MPKFKSDKITIYLGNKLKIEAEKFATEKEMSLSEFIRYLIMQYSDKTKNN